MGTHFSANPDQPILAWAGSSGELTRNPGQRTTSPVSILSTFSALCEDQSPDLETDDMVLELDYVHCHSHETSGHPTL